MGRGLDSSNAGGASDRRGADGELNYREISNLSTDDIRGGHSQINSILHRNKKRDWEHGEVPVTPRQQSWGVVADPFHKGN